MQYGLIETESGMKLFHAEELPLIAKKVNSIDIVPLNEDELSVLVGIVKLQKGIDENIDIEQFHELLSEEIVNPMAYILGQKLVYVEMLDFLFNTTEDNEIVFAALMMGKISPKKFNAPIFFLNPFMEFMTAIQNRKIMFNWEKVNPSKKVTEENWREILKVDYLTKNESFSQEKDYYQLYIEDRIKVLEKVKQLPSITTDTFYTYHLSHTYNHDDTPVTKFIINIEPHTMDLLIAYIQIELDKIDPHVSLMESDLVEIVKELYVLSDNAAANNEYQLFPCKIDLYINWEYWCGIDNEIENIPLFKRERLTDLLNQKILNY